MRKSLAATAPEGELEFCAEEWGPRGEGFRFEKRYREPTEHVRSVLIAADGRVLERWHTLPVAEVPHHVLATALRHGHRVRSTAIVSGAEREEHWQIVVTDRTGRTFAVRVDLDGAMMQVRRRSRSVVDG